jgi:Integrase core domain
LARQPHVVVPDPNRRWATDLTTGWTRRDGWVGVVPTIDCWCRSVLALEVTKDQSASVVLRSIDALLLERFGTAAAVPAGLELRTDHGPQYTGQDCAELLARWGLTHTGAGGLPDGQRGGRAPDPDHEGGGDLAPGLGGRRGIACAARGVAAPLQRDATAPGPRLADAAGVTARRNWRQGRPRRVSEKPHGAVHRGDYYRGQPEALRDSPCVALSAPHPTPARTAIWVRDDDRMPTRSFTTDFRRMLVSCAAGNTRVEETRQGRWHTLPANWCTTLRWNGERNLASRQVQPSRPLRLLRAVTLPEGGGAWERNSYSALSLPRRDNVPVIRRYFCGRGGSNAPKGPFSGIASGAVLQEAFQTEVDLHLDVRGVMSSKGARTPGRS